MKYSIYKLEFQTGVHLGMGMLNESEYTFRADQLFSALYIEALKLKCEKEFYDCVKRGKLLFSDAFPYLGKTYMIPKPMLYVEPKVRGISEQKKLFKKMKFISIEQIEEFLNGTMNLSEDPMKNYGEYIDKINYYKNYFFDKMWDKLDKEQLVFEGDTLYYCVY